MAPKVATRLLLAGLAGTTIVCGKPHGNKYFNTTASINPKKLTGKPEHLASGMIYGIPDQPLQIPDHFYEDIAFRFGRAGGAQLDEPARGWIWGPSEYEARLNSTLSNYETCRRYGAEFQILPHDIWGTDRTNDSSVWPGDDGDWTDYDLFLDTLLSDLKERNAVDGTYFEIWNEPDLPDIFWQRSQQQWLDLYIRTHKRIRSDPELDNMRIDGPSFAYQPEPTNDWYTNWMASIAGNDTIPDQYVLHLLGDRLSPINDLQNAQPTFQAMLANFSLPERQINVNEYATTEEQRPAGAAWWISRLERYGAIGLRANWLSGTTLHDLMANLLTKEEDPEEYLATDYLPTGEYQVYKFYVQNMTGSRVETTGSKDRFFDVYATLDGDEMKVLAGSRVEAGEWRIEVPVKKGRGEVEVKRWSFPGKTQFSVLEEPVDEGTEMIQYGGGKLVLDVKTDNTTAHAFEFQLPC